MPLSFGEGPPVPGKGSPHGAASSWSTSRRRFSSRPKNGTTTWTWRGSSSTSTTVPTYPANGPSTTRTCCPFCGKGAASRCSSMSSPSSSVRQVSDRAPSQALYLPLSIYNDVARPGIRGEFYLHSAELLPHFLRIVQGCDC